MLMYSKGTSYNAASSSVRSMPKSMIHISRGRCVISTPFIHFRITSVLGRPCGLGLSSISMTTVAEMSKSPTFPMPWNARFRFSNNGLAVVRSNPIVKSALMAGTLLPSSVRSVSVPLSKQMIEICTAAPSSTQSLSEIAENMSPVSLMRVSTGRLDWNLIACVASRPARLVAPVSICPAPSPTSSSRGRWSSVCGCRTWYTPRPHNHRPVTRGKARVPKTAGCPR